tara:strand:+ start:1054 stop:2331 length:1278 start_codon:yes stop_codon:yes gene_type:complete
MVKQLKKIKKIVNKRKTKKVKTLVQQSYKQLITAKGRNVVAGRDIKQFFQTTPANTQLGTINEADIRTARNFASQDAKAHTARSLAAAPSTWDNPPAFSSPYSEWNRPATTQQGPNWDLMSRANTNPQIGGSQANTQGQAQSIRRRPPRLRGSGTTRSPRMVVSATDRIMMRDDESSDSGAPPLQLHRRSAWSQSDASVHPSSSIFRRGAVSSEESSGSLRTQASAKLAPLIHQAAVREAQYGSSSSSGSAITASSRPRSVTFGTERAAGGSQPKALEEEPTPISSRSAATGGGPLDRFMVSQERAEQVRERIKKREHDIPSMTAAAAKKEAQRTGKEVNYRDSQGKLKAAKVQGLPSVKEVNVEEAGYSSGSGYDIPTKLGAKVLLYEKWRKAGFNPKDKPAGQRNSKFHKWNYKKGRWDDKKE